MRTEALEAPFPIGTKVSYPGPDFRMEGGPWVRKGDVGVVTSIIEGIDGHPELGEDLAQPSDASSVIRFHGSDRATRAVSADGLRRRCDMCPSWGDPYADEEFCDGPHDAYEAVQ